MFRNAGLYRLQLAGICAIYPAILNDLSTRQAAGISGRVSV
jgi:hypothetical protein